MKRKRQIELGKSVIDEYRLQEAIFYQEQARYYFGAMRTWREAFLSGRHTKDLKGLARNNVIEIQEATRNNAARARILMGIVDAPVAPGPRGRGCLKVL